MRQLLAGIGDGFHLKLSPEHGRRNENAEDRDGKSTQSTENNRCGGIFEVAQADGGNALSHSSEKAA